MNRPFNKLTDAQAERLALLLEELGEAQQAIGKILRHGYNCTHPNGGPTNRDLLERELGDILAAIDLLCMPENYDLSNKLIQAAKSSKLQRVGKYLHHQSGGGCYAQPNT